MGQSQQSFDKQPKDFISSFNKSHLDDKLLNYLSYKGIRTNSNQSNETLDTSYVSTTDECSNTKTQEFKFCWYEEAKEVFLVGSFTNWTTLLMMEKDADSNCYSLKLKLPKEKHSFKFIINNEWKCSESYNKQTDNNGNINNIIDLSELKFSPKKSAESKNSRKNTLLDETYASLIPDKCLLNDKVPNTPSAYENTVKVKKSNYHINL